MSEATITLTKRELTHVRVGLLQRLNNLRNAIEKMADLSDTVRVRAEAQTSYDEVVELLNGKFWDAVKELRQ